MDKRPRFEIYKSNGKHLFKIISANNRTITISEPYNSRKHCLIAVNSIIAIVPNAEVIIKNPRDE